jgi:DNA-binding LacI/PurR family transcriptional regulator
MSQNRFSLVYSKVKMPSPAKAPRICADLREEIVRGSLQPGDRLPTRAELTERFGVSSITLQHALNQLVGEGFVEADGRRGTFVTAKPPHLSHFALLLPDVRPTATKGNHFFRVFCTEAERVAQRRGLSMEVVEGVQGFRSYGHYQRLTEDIRESRLAGLIFASIPYLLEDSPILDLPGIPRVAVSRDQRYANVHTVWTNHEEMLTRGLAYLQAEGRHRVAVLTHGAFGNSVEMIRRCCPAGIRIEDHLIQAMPLEEPGWAAHAVRLLARLPAAERPDGFLIMDDNLVTAAMAGFDGSGLVIGSDISVVAHANFPDPTEAPATVCRIGFQVDRMISHSIDQILAWRHGHADPTPFILPALFDHELD